FLNEVNAIIRQISSDTNAWKSENAIYDILRSVRHILAIDTFPCISETVEFIYDLNSKAEVMQIGYDLLKQDKRIAFISTGAVMARVLVKKASKLSKSDNSPIRTCIYYGDMDEKQRQKDFFDINIAWVIAITNIATSVHVEALA
ncbi:1286_t:CDS:2, partial [Funneliformis geosporum]